MTKVFTLKRENMGATFDTTEFDAWMADHPTAKIVTTSNSDWVLVIVVQEPA